MKLPPQQIEKIRAELADEIANSAAQEVVDGGDLDRGRVSLTEFLADSKIVIAADDQAVLIVDPDSERALSIRNHVEEMTRSLVHAWFESPRGREWLSDQVELQAEEAIADAEIALEAIASAKAAFDERNTKLATNAGEKRDEDHHRNRS